MSEDQTPTFEDMDPEGGAFEGNGHPSRQTNPDRKAKRNHSQHPGSFGRHDDDLFDDDLFELDEFDALADDEFADLEDFAGDFWLEDDWDAGMREENDLYGPLPGTAVRKDAGGAPDNAFGRSKPSRRRRTDSSRSPHHGNRRPWVTDPANSVCSADVRETHELLSRMAAIAANSTDEVEALGLMAATVPVAMRLVPEAYRGLWPTLPGLVRGVVYLTRDLFGSPSQRQYIRHVPLVVQTSLERLGRHVLRGKPVSKQLAARVLTMTAEDMLTRFSRAGRGLPRRKRGPSGYEDR